jgi:cytochrome b subunit of formate dehydrogenase
VAPTAAWSSVGSNYFEFKRPIGRLPGGAFFIVYSTGFGIVFGVYRADGWRSMVGVFLGWAMETLAPYVGRVLLVFIFKFKSWST